MDYSDGSFYYKKDQTIGIYSVTEDGTLIITDLPMGKYKLQEIETLDGYVLDEKIYTVEFIQTDTTTKVYEYILNLENLMTTVEISKTDIGGHEVEGAELKIIDKDGNIIDNWISTKEKHIIKGLIEGETYTLVEEYAPFGYVLAKSIRFTVNGEIPQSVKMINKQVKAIKIDIEGNRVVGAKLKVIDRFGNIVDNWTTTNIEHTINGLIEGETYILVEEFAPEGFVISKSQMFTVTNNKNTQIITMIDKVVEMTKKDIGGNEIEGATIQIIDKNKKIVDEWVSSKEPHKINNLIEGETYTLHEEIAIDGYVKATDIEFTVSEEKETQQIELIDKVVLISKTDLTTGKELPGAELIVTDKDGNIVDKWISTTDPHYVSGLEEGQEYTLTEITCPYGFEQAESIRFKVSTDKQTQLIQMQDMPILKTIILIKTDSETKDIIKEDFRFGIYEDAECTKLIREVISDKENGTVTFENLRYGIYYIKELEAPKGYQLSNKIVKIEINDKGTFADDELLEDKDSICEFNYYNKPIPKIQTGNEVNYILLISIVAISLLIIILGIVLLKRNYEDLK